MPTTTRKRLIGPMSQRLRQAREDTGMSRKAFAERLGVAERTVNYYEDPRYQRARKSYVVRAWAEAAGRTFEELWGKPGKEISRTACNDRTRSPFLTSERDPKGASSTSLPLRRRSA